MSGGGGAPRWRAARPLLVCLAGCVEGEVADEFPALTDMEVSVLGAPEAVAELTLEMGPWEVVRETFSRNPHTFALPDLDPRGGERLARVAAIGADGAYLGVSDVSLRWLPTADPGELGGDPFPAGWSLAWPTDFGIFRAEGNEVVVETALALQPTLSLAGVVSASEVDGRSLALVAGMAWSDQPPAVPTLADGPATETWAVAWDGPPPEGHQMHILIQPTEELVTDDADYSLHEASVEVPLLYEDSDVSGGWSTGDVEVAIGTVYGKEVLAAWLPPPLTYVDAMYAVRAGHPRGWVVVAGEQVREAAALEVEFATGE